MTFTRLHSLLSHLVFVRFVILIFHYYVSLVFVYIKQHFLFNSITIICSFKFTSTATYQTLHFSYLVDRSFILIFNGSFILITFRRIPFLLSCLIFVTFDFLICNAILSLHLIKVPPSSSYLVFVEIIILICNDHHVILIFILLRQHFLIKHYLHHLSLQVYIHSYNRACCYTRILVIQNYGLTTKIQ